MPTDHASDTQLLRKTLRANGIFSVVSGAGLAVADGLFAALLGHLDAVPLVRAIGLAVLAFGVFALWLASRDPVPRGLALGVFLADLGWVVLSVIALFAGVFSPQGSWAVAIVAAAVGAFAISEWRGLQQSEAPAAG